MKLEKFSIKRFNLSTILLTSITIFTIMVNSFLFSKYQKLKQSLEELESLRTQIREDNYQYIDSLNKNNIVFLGDSIVEFGQWNEYFDENIVNRGIGGNTTEDIVKRIHYITDSKPKNLFLLFGINDILQGKSQKVILDNYCKIIKTIQESSSKTKINIISVLPMNSISETDIKNSIINEINSELKKISNQNNLIFIDVHDEFLSQDGQLDLMYTIDGIHLNGKGYDLLSNKLKHYIK